MAKLLRTFLLFLCVPVALTAQQDLQYTHFAFNKQVYNPAFSGLNPYIDLNGLYRSQWTGLSGSPESQLLSGSMPLYMSNSGVGFVLINDVLGVEQDLEFKVSYAYHLGLGNGRLSIGAQAGIIQKSLDGTKLRAPDGEYLDFNPIVHNDPLIPATKVGAMTPDAGVGVAYTTERFFVGLSATHVLPGQFSYDLPASTLKISTVPHLFLNTGYDFELTSDWTLSPALLLKSDLVKMQSDLSIIASFDDFLWGGLSLRGYNGKSLDALAGLIGVRPATNLRVGYSFDYPLSALANAHSGSHELFLNYRIPWEKPRAGKIINNPRFLSF